MSGPEGGTVASLTICPPRGKAYSGATLGLGMAAVTSLPDYTAAKERARQHQLDRAIMDRAAHLKVHK